MHTCLCSGQAAANERDNLDLEMDVNLNSNVVTDIDDGTMLNTEPDGHIESSQVLISLG